MSDKTWSRHLFSHPWWIVVSLTLLLVFMSVGAKNLYFRGDYRVFFKEDNPQRVAYEKMQRIFTKNESVSIVISRPDGTLFNETSLSLIKRLTDDSWQVPLTTRVDSITNFQHTYAQDDDLVVEDLLLELDWLDQERLEIIRKVSLSEVDLVNKLISPDGRVALININVQLPDGDQTKEITEIGNFVRDMISPYQSEFPEHELRLSGIVIMTDAMFIAAIKDATTLFPLMFVVITILLIVLMRSFYATLATLFMVTICITATLGIGGWFGMFINIASANVPVIIMTLAIADSVHLISGMRFCMLGGDDKVTAIKKSLKLNTKPIVITSLTTMVGFLTLNFAEVPILADLGNLVAIGVMLACVISLTLLPCMLLIMPVSFKANKQESTQPVWNLLAHTVVKWHRALLIFTIVITGVGGYLAAQNNLNDIAIEYFNKENPFRQDADFQQENLSGLSTIDFAVYTDRDGDINTPQFLQTIADFTDWLQQREEVDHVISFSNTMKRLNKNMNQDDESFYVLPGEKNLAAQYLLLYEMSLPFGLDVNNQIDINKSATRVMVTLKNLGSKDFTGFETQAKEWMRERAPEYTIEAASLPLIFAHIGKSNMQSMLIGAVVALTLISCMLIFALRSFKLGLVSLLPNLMPALIGFALWALISGNISMALSVVLTMTLGIIVDDTVHFLSKYKSALDKGMSALQSIEFAFNNVGNALVVTTVVLSSGFAILAFSDFAINSDMGTLTAIIIAVALVVDLTLLPALLVFIYKNYFKTA